jgi:hypothetical protein
MSTTYIDTPRKGDALKADWAKSVADKIRSQSITPGPGLHARTTPAGTTITRVPDAPPPPGAPEPFELRWRINELTQELELVCYIGKHDVQMSGHAQFFRNGRPVERTPTSPTRDTYGWHTIDDLPDRTTYYIFARAQNVDRQLHAGDDSWEILWHEDIRLGLDYERADTPVLIGIIHKGAILQTHTGNIYTYYTPADGDAPRSIGLGDAIDNGSLEIDGGALQLIGWHNGVTETIGDSLAPYSIPMRKHTVDGVELVYVSLSHLLTRLIQEMTP